ncbi:hypothetical protein [Methylobacterium sp.]|uniref:hypothetical protein n=1 Tax=Methylobacterium sp. TaxID=409 RepID=UPI003B02B078
MGLRSETPPPPADLAVESPTDSDRPTSAMLKADIDSGRTGDKIPHYDVGLSPLGTDDEAAGNTPSKERIAMARGTEAASPRVQATARATGRDSWVMPLYIGLVVLAAVVIGGSLYLLRA